MKPPEYEGKGLFHHIMECMKAGYDITTTERIEIDINVTVLQWIKYQVELGKKHGDKLTVNDIIQNIIDDFIERSKDEQMEEWRNKHWLTLLDPGGADKVKALIDKEK